MFSEQIILPQVTLVLLSLVWCLTNGGNIPFTPSTEFKWRLEGGREGETVFSLCFLHLVIAF